MNDGAATIDGTLGVAGTAISGNTGNEIANYISTAARVLDDNDVPAENRWLVAAPQFFEILRQADSKIMDQSVTGGPSALFNGKVTDRKIHGFDLYQTNVMVVGSQVSSSKYIWPFNQHLVKLMCCLDICLQQLLHLILLRQK